MNLIKPSVEIISEPDNIKRIELAGRTCYKSESKITSASAGKFVRALIEKKHESVLEHSNIVVECRDDDSTQNLENMLVGYQFETGRCSFIRHDSNDLDCREDRDGRTTYGNNIFSGNVRAWRAIAKRYRGEIIIASLFAFDPLFSDIGFDKSLLEELGTEDAFNSNAIPVCGDFGDNHNIITARFICDRGISHQLVRHRALSFSQESTRYVKYGSDMQFIQPWWWEDDSMCKLRVPFELACGTTSKCYTKLIEEGSSPQLARAVLTNAIKTEVVATGTISMWKDFLYLRDNKKAHPDMQILAKMFSELTGIKGEMRCN